MRSRDRVMSTTFGIESVGYRRRVSSTPPMNVRPKTQVVRFPFSINNRMMLTHDVDGKLAPIPTHFPILGEGKNVGKLVSLPQVIHAVSRSCSQSCIPYYCHHPFDDDNCSDQSRWWVPLTSSSVEAEKKRVLLVENAVRQNPLQ